MKIHIKYMLSLRCVMIVEMVLRELNLLNGTVVMGEADVHEHMTTEQHNHLKKALLALGLELMDKNNASLIEKIKQVILEMVHENSGIRKIKNSVYISGKLNYDYTYLANIFSIDTGFTIERFVINSKIERVKELIRFNKLSLAQISYQMNYSSAAHLSNQFKKVTGLTPSSFRQLHYRAVA